MSVTVEESELAVEVELPGELALDIASTNSVGGPFKVPRELLQTSRSKYLFPVRLATYITMLIGFPLRRPYIP